MQFGAYTFVETRRDPATGESVLDKAFADDGRRSRGVDVFGLGEIIGGYAVSAPAVALAAAAARTKRIRLSSAVTVLSSDDRARLQFAPRSHLQRPRRDHGRARLVRQDPPVRL